MLNSILSERIFMQTVMQFKDLLRVLEPSNRFTKNLAKLLHTAIRAYQRLIEDYTDKLISPEQYYQTIDELNNTIHAIRLIIATGDYTNAGADIKAVQQQPNHVLYHVLIPLLPLLLS